MCPRATAQEGGAAMARAAAASFSFVGVASAHSFGEEEYIDLDLSSCGEFEFRVRRSNADELSCRGGRVAAVQSKSVTKTQEADVASGGCGGRRSAATVAPLQHSHSAVAFRDAPAAAREGSSRRRKAAARGGLQAKLQASRAFFRSLFARTSCSDNGAAVRARTKAAAPCGDTKKGGCNKAPFGEMKNGYGSSRVAEPTTLRRSIEQEKLMDEAELAARQRKSFSGVIRWRHATTTSSSPAPAPKPLSSSSARRSSVAGSGGGGIGPGQLKRSNSARSESEGLIQGAIAYCKRSQQQLGLARKSVSDAAALCPGPPPPSYSWPSNPTRSAPAYRYYY
ncbi:hypothetical protein QOZ80_3BG0284710 [Eleusine coracana subsp. coracana]|nr:hypothetical protein QOZ80_3BG0284710 [Eleusine coracana subsp. coracana]